MESTTLDNSLDLAYPLDDINSLHSAAHSGNLSLFIQLIEKYGETNFVMTSDLDLQV